MNNRKTSRIPTLDCFGLLPHAKGCLSLTALLLMMLAAVAQPATVDTKLDADQGRIAIQAEFKGKSGSEEKTIYGAVIQHAVKITNEKMDHTISIKVDAIQGGLKEIVFTLLGDGEIKQVTGAGLEDWSVRKTATDRLALVLRLSKSEKPLGTFSGQIIAETRIIEPGKTLSALTLTTEPSTLANGFVRIDTDAALELHLSNPTGLIPIENAFLPEGFRNGTTNATSLAFRFLGTPYSLPIAASPTDPEYRSVVLNDFRLVGQLAEDRASFTLTATARVKNPKGGSVELLSGGLALTEIKPQAGWRLDYVQGRFIATFDKAGEYAVAVNFEAAVKVTNSWNEVDFNVASGSLQPVVLQGLKGDTQFRFQGAARTKRSGEEFESFLPPGGKVHLAWQEKRPEAEGALFFAAEELALITLSPGVMRQNALLDFKVMQGELKRMVVLVKGDGEVTRVQGPQVLSWKLEQIDGSAERKLIVQFNQPQKDSFTIQVQTQTPLGAFPQAADVTQLRPEGATRFGGYLKIVNEGAVRLETLKASGLSQISPGQFPQTEATKSMIPNNATQVFAYRFSSGVFELRIQADNILPELSVSEVLSYRLGETEQSIDAEIEIDVREAPLRELLLHVPKGFAAAHIVASGMSDYFLTDPADQPDAQLRIVYGTPALGRLLVQLRLERNSPAAGTSWNLPRVEVVKAKSVRGHVGIAADAGFRLTPATTKGLTELATAFYPKKTPGLQSAFRLSDPLWQATMNIERLPQSIQVDAFHLFSVGEGIAYGSTVANYLISGAPISAFKVGLTNEYFNVEFTGKDVRNWQKIDGGYLVQLHTPVSGPYTLLATYERPFKAQGETLRFTGAQPLDAQSEQGYTIVVSAYQFQVRPVTVSAGLVLLEPGEVPAEYRLFFDAPILAAYRYNARPFDLQLELKPLTQGETISQVVDRASLITRISKDGQVVTTARYFVKNKGVPNLRMVLPEGSQLWSVTVNGSPVVPVTADRANLIPMPQKSDPNSVNDLEIKIAARAVTADRLTVAAPIISAPVLLAEWNIEPESGQRLIYRHGTLTPVEDPAVRSGFAGLLRLWGYSGTLESSGTLIIVLGLLAIGIMVFRMGTADGVGKFSSRHILCGLVGMMSLGIACLVLLRMAIYATNMEVPPQPGLHFVAPIQQADSPLLVELANTRMSSSLWENILILWPALLTAVLWLYAFANLHSALRNTCLVFGWLFLFWAALRFPNGATALFFIALAFVAARIILPLMSRWLKVPRKPIHGLPPTGLAGTSALILFSALCWSSLITTAQPTAGETGNPVKPPALAEYVIQSITVQDEFALGSAKVRWQAVKGQVLPLLHSPAVLTKIEITSDAARLIRSGADNQSYQALIAEKTGTVEAGFDFQLPISLRNGERGFVLPTQYGLVNRLTLTLTGMDADLRAPQAISTLRKDSGSATNALFELVLAPVNDSWIGWQPRSRDTRREKAVYYAEVSQLYVPAAGVIEGWHFVQIRPAQGELSELVFDVPTGLTITDVSASNLSVWRFDPSARKLRVGISPALAKPFGIIVKSQTATGPLPVEQSVGLLAVSNAAGQVGLIGIASGPEVQLDDVKGEGLTTINLEDFPSFTFEPLANANSGIMLRRAFRYLNPSSVASLKASAVEPDVRVESQQTLSLGEDRTVLAANLNVAITRAGIFKLRFVLPTGLDVESVSGAAMSHWTELKTDEGRVVTLHMNSRTDGTQQFAITLSGSGLRTAKGWSVPKIRLLEAAKEQGQILIVPEQGMRLQIATKDGVTQLDPVQAGVRQKGVLAFRLLQTEWKLSLDIERVDAWTQVTGLQRIVINEALIQVAANFQYEIENAGIKTLRVRLPAAAESVRFRGDQLADFLPHAVQTNDTVRDWEIKLHRRVSGKYLLHVNYATPLAEKATDTMIQGIEVQEINLQRGFVTVQSGSRLQARIDAAPSALQPAEWQSIPRALQQEMAGASADFTFRLVDAAFKLPLRLDRHEATKLLPARVNSVGLTSVISDDGMMLTQVRVTIIPGDKQLLSLALPPNAKFWFAFVGQNTVWPWRENDRILIPLEQHSKTGEPVLVEFLYSGSAGNAKSRSLNLSLVGPKFDLPLENISWQVFLNRKWDVRNWSSSLQFQDQSDVPQPIVVDVESYVRQEAGAQKEQTREAEQFLSTANSLLEKGDPEQARRAFQNAFGLSRYGSAFNEDARVQLHNLKTQQALVGLNVRQAKAAGETAAAAVTPRNLRDGQTTAYTQQEAKQLIDRNTAEDNAVQMRLVERLIQQQEAVVASPSAIRATVPEQGRKLTFSRALQVETESDLRIDLKTVEVRGISFRLKLLLLAGTFAMLITLHFLMRGSQRPTA